jgi:hypothetical protein
MSGFFCRRGEPCNIFPDLSGASLTAAIVDPLQVVSTMTEYQRVDVYDVLRPDVQSLELYDKSLSNDGSYEAEHPEFFAPDRIVFLDGVMQSRSSGDAAYHGNLKPYIFSFNRFSNTSHVRIISCCNRITGASSYVCTHMSEKSGHCWWGGRSYP